MKGWELRGSSPPFGISICKPNLVFQNFLNFVFCKVRRLITNQLIIPRRPIEVFNKVIRIEDLGECPKRRFVPFDGEFRPLGQPFLMFNGISNERWFLPNNSE